MWTHATRLTRFELILHLPGNCRGDDECNLREACIDERCQDPCQSASEWEPGLYRKSPHCPGNWAACHANENHEAVCTCHLNHPLGDPYDKQEGCYNCLKDGFPNDDLCEDHQFCDNNMCMDTRCNCEENEECRRTNHTFSCLSKKKTTCFERILELD